MGAIKTMNTLTLRDFVEQLTQSASLDARVVFKIECEDKNFDAGLEFSRVTCLSPATEVVVTMADNTEDVRKGFENLDIQLGQIQDEWKERDLKLKTLMESAREEKWTATQILNELEGV